MLNKSNTPSVLKCKKKKIGQQKLMYFIQNLYKMYQLIYDDRDLLIFLDGGSIFFFGEVVRNSSFKIDKWII